MSVKKLFIIDAMAMAFRNYHAFGQRPLSTSEGLPTSAVFGSTQFLLKLIEEQKPDYFCIATDSKAPTFRHKLYDQYKANRTAMPEDLSQQIPYLYELFEKLNIPLLKLDGYEADDIIGTIVKKLAGPDLHCYIVSGDKDFMQLVNDSVFLYSPKKNEPAIIIDAQGVYEKFGCKPEQVIDALAILGDSSDNVPGVKGIGDKGVAQLIQEFHSLDEIYRRIDDVRNNRQREALINFQKDAYLARQLVTIFCEVPVPLELNTFAYDSEKFLITGELLEFCKKLEFRSLVTKISELSKNIKKPMLLLPQEEQQTSFDSYMLIDNAEKLEKFFVNLELAPVFSFDTETTGLDIINDQPIGLSVSVEPGQGYYLPLHPRHQNPNMNWDDVKEKLKKIFASPNQMKVAHNLKFDYQMLANYGIEVKPPLADTMIAAHLLDPLSRETSLDACSLKFFNYVKIPTSTLIGERGEKPMLDAPLPDLARYACEDSDFTLRLYFYLQKALQKEDMLKAFEMIECPLVPVLARMEQAGIYVDSNILADISESLDTKAKELQIEIYALAGEQFNISSPQQLQIILFEKLKIHEQLNVKRLKKTKTGYSTDQSVLEKLRAHPLAKALLSYRTITKLKNTYVDTLPQLINPKTQRIHTHFHQIVTATGRLSSSDPNLQNIPIRSDLGKEVRKAFCVQNSERVLISADYSQVELRVMADLANDKNMIASFQENTDFHTSTAAKIFGITPDQVDATLRSRAKAINFGIVYGMGPQRLSRDTGVSFDEAKQFIEKYFQQFPGVADFIKNSRAFARQNGHSVTMFGRKRPIPEYKTTDPLAIANAENIAVNSPVQGSAAELVKIAMIKLDKVISEQGFDAKLLLQVHDELVVECAFSQKDQVSRATQEVMENAVKLHVPLRVELGVGRDWLEAH